MVKLGIVNIRVYINRYSMPIFVVLCIHLSGATTDIVIIHVNIAYNSYTYTTVQGHIYLERVSIFSWCTCYSKSTHYLLIFKDVFSADINLLVLHVLLKVRDSG